jgi:Amino-transferase class IV
MAEASDGIAYMNGTYCPVGEATVPILDPGFTRGDAVYDTVSVWKGNFFRLDDHIERFFRSCASNRLDPPATPDELKLILAQCVHRAGLDTSYVQMISTRGKFPSTAVRDPDLHEHTHRRSVCMVVHIPAQLVWSAFGWRSELLAEFELLDLAARRSGQLVDDDESLGGLLAGDSLGDDVLLNGEHRDFGALCPCRSAVVESERRPAVRPF